LISQYLEVMCLKSSWYSKYLFLFLTLAEVSMSCGRPQLGIAFDLKEDVSRTSIEASNLFLRFPRMLI